MDSAMRKSNKSKDKQTSSYQIFSRAACNFVFPKNIERPYPKSREHMNEDDMETYTDEEGLPACLDCPFPYWTSRDGSSTCQAIYLNLSDFLQVVILMFTAGMWIIGVSMVDKRNRIDVGLYLLFPALDFFTDLAYLLYSVFYTKSLFILNLMIFAAPLIHFIHILMAKRCACRSFYPFFMKYNY